MKKNISNWFSRARAEYGIILLFLGSCTNGIMNIGPMSDVSTSTDDSESETISLGPTDTTTEVTTDSSDISNSDTSPSPSTDTTTEVTTDSSDVFDSDTSRPPSTDSSTELMTDSSYIFDSDSGPFSSTDSGTEVEDSSCGEDGVRYESSCWYLGLPGESCIDVCALHGGYSDATSAVTGTTSEGGTREACQDILQLLGFDNKLQVGIRESEMEGLGCHVWDEDLWWLSYPNISPNKSALYAERVCACAM